MKRILAVAVIAALCVCLCSCGYNPQVVGSVKDADGEGTEISCGRYLVAQFTASDSALYTFDPTGSSDFASVLKGEIDGTDAREWIAQETERLIMRAAAVDRIGADNGIAFTPDEKYVYDYSIGYGWSSYHDIYMANGISYDTFYDYQMNIALDAELTLRLYGTGGPMELDEEIVKDYRDNKTARVTLLLLPGTPSDSSITLTDEDLAMLDELAAKVYAEVQESGDFSAVREAYEPLYEEILGEGCLDGAYSSSVLAIEGDGRYSADMMKALLGSETGDYGLLDAGSHNYSVFRREELKESDTLDYIRDSICDIVAADRYEELIDEYTKGWTLDLDQKAVKYYSVDKVTFN